MLAVAHNSELDRGTHSVGPGMERHCALTRQLKPVGELIAEGWTDEEDTESA